MNILFFQVACVCVCVCVYVCVCVFISADQFTIVFVIAYSHWEDSNMIVTTTVVHWSWLNQIACVHVQYLTQHIDYCVHTLQLQHTPYSSIYTLYISSDYTFGMRVHVTYMYMYTIQRGPIAKYWAWLWYLYTIQVYRETLLVYCIMYLTYNCSYSFTYYIYLYRYTMYV